MVKSVPNAVKLYNVHTGSKLRSVEEAYISSLPSFMFPLKALN